MLRAIATTDCSAGSSQNAMVQTKSPAKRKPDTEVRISVASTAKVAKARVPRASVMNASSSKLIDNSSILQMHHFFCPLFFYLDEKR